MKIRIRRSAISRARSRKGIGVVAVGPAPGRPSVVPNAVPSLRSDSISRKPVGNQIGPRQFELPPLIRTVDSAGS